MAEYTRQCAHCDTEFIAGRKSTRHCSRKCHNADVHGQICAICGGAMLISLTGSTSGTRAHAHCWREVGLPRNCEYRGCDAPFLAKSADNVYCSKTHAIMASQLRKGPACVICGEKMHLQPGLKEEPAHIECRRTRWVEGACMVCGRPMSTEHRRRCYECSATQPCAVEWCQNGAIARGLCRWHYAAKRRKRQVTLHISRSLRLSIYERDGWVCQLCGHPIDRDAAPRTRWSASLDHIEPQSAALVPDNRPTNLRTAHFGCNSSRRHQVRRDARVRARAERLLEESAQQPK